MATLTRLTGKVFAGNAELTNLGVFGSAADGEGINPTGTNTEAQIQADSAYEAGWTDAVVTNKNFPPIEEVNGVLRTISYQACYLLQEGIPVWDTNTVYSNTSIVKVINGSQLDFYISQREQSGNTPQTDGGTNWKKAIITGDREIGVPQITLDFDSELPEGYVDLDGREVSQTTYNNLYSIYQNTYNKGDEDVGNFRLPDFTDRAIYGGFTAGYIDAGLPDLGLTVESSGYHKHTGSAVQNGNHDHDATSRNNGSHQHASGRTSSNDDGGDYFTTGNQDNKSGIYTLSAGSHNHVIDVDKNGNHTHTLNIDYDGTHSHSITTNAIVGSANTVLTDGIKVRVFTRYK